MTAPTFDRRPVPLRDVARHWLPICRAILANSPPDPMKQHARAMGALRKANKR